VKRKSAWRQLCLDLGLVDEAIEAGRRALLLRPQDMDAHSRLLFYAPPLR